MLKKFSLEKKVAFTAAVVLLIILTVNMLSAVYGTEKTDEVKKFFVTQGFEAAE